MGLCKCPKRRVTNQFCFEHRVNVCENCMVTNHPKCIVQSYLQWLQDSDYNPVCELCTRKLQLEECIRLTCYHVFHWSCAESHFRSLPLTTAPAGYQCPSCAESVFPPPNLVSPVADVLRERLAGVNWARAGLGLPLLSEDQDMKGSFGRRRSQSDQSNYYQDGGSAGSAGSHRGTPVGASDDDSTSNVSNGLSHSIVQMQDDSGIYDSTSVKRNDGQIPRKVFQDLDQTRAGTRFDHDENKYKQKSTFAWILRWWKNTIPSQRTRRPGAMPRKYWLLLIVVLVVVGGLVLLSQVERSIEEDPFGAQPNENIRVLSKN